MARVAEIYAAHVLEGFGTFEETPPDAAEMDARRRSVQSLQLPFLVLEADRVQGFAYASPFRTRSAYRYTAEDSVYVAADQVGRGVGAALLAGVILDCERLGLRRMLAVIGDSDNAASIALHARHGFQACGLFPAVGYKRGRWLDVVLMDKPLNGGAIIPPSEPGLRLD
jgi:phosphinothricin acetyltransferase